ncbi:MAG: aminotransferase class IV [Bacteroidota bacterium]
MGYFFNYNGKTFEEGTPVIQPDSRALRYGDGLFETLKIKNEQILFEDEHFSRLWKGLKLLGFDIPPHFTPEKLSSSILALAKKNKHEKLVRVRLNVFRGNGGINDPENFLPNYIIQTWELPDTAGTLNSNGLTVGIYNDAKKSCDAFSNIKHNNYLPSVMGALKAKEEQWNDAIILNSFDRICETTIANIFLIKNKTIITPAKEEGCIEGIMRLHLIQQLKLNDWKVEQSKVSLDDLMAAEEIFVTNSINNMRWVKQIGDKMLGSKIIQEIYTSLSSTFL